MFRYPVESFEHEAPFRRLLSVARRGKHVVFETELVAGDDRRALVINPMLGGRFDVAVEDEPRQPTWVFSLRLDGGEELRYLDFRDMGRLYWVYNLEEVPGWARLGPEADAVGGEDLET